MRAWLFQDHRQKKKLGDKAPWSVGWVDPEGKRRSKRVGSESMAKKFRRKKEGELAAGLCSTENRKQWKDSKVEFDKKIAAGAISWVLLEGIGNAVTRNDVPPALVRDAVRRLAE